MVRMSVYEAKNSFSKIVNEIMKDENKEIIVERYNKPVVRIVAYKEPSNPRKPGLAKKYKGLIDHIAFTAVLFRHLRRL